MSSQIACTRCNGTHSGPPAFLITCSECHRSWHHRCHIPPIEDEELIRRIKATTAGDDDNGLHVWVCRRCKKNKGKSSAASTAGGSTSRQISESVSAPGSAGPLQERSTGLVVEVLQAIKVIPTKRPSGSVVASGGDVQHETEERNTHLFVELPHLAKVLPANPNVSRKSAYKRAPNAIVQSIISDDECVSDSLPPTSEVRDSEPPITTRSSDIAMASPVSPPPAPHRNARHESSVVPPTELSVARDEVDDDDDDDMNNLYASSTSFNIIRMYTPLAQARAREEESNQESEEEVRATKVKLMGKLAPEWMRARFPEGDNPWSRAFSNRDLEVPGRARKPRKSQARKLDETSLAGVPNREIGLNFTEDEWIRNHVR